MFVQIAIKKARSQLIIGEACYERLNLKFLRIRVTITIYLQMIFNIWIYLKVGI